MFPNTHAARDGGRGESNRDLSDWTRKGPLADLPSRGGSDRRGGDFGDRPERPERRPFRDAAADDGRTRDFGNWERKGPLSPLAQPEGAAGGFREREGSRPRNENRGESFRADRQQAPATWGEGAARQDSRPPRREFADRPERPERVPTAAEKDNQWRSNMRPDSVKASPGQSRDGSEAPASPGATTPAAAPAAPVGRPRLNLQKRTVSEATDALSPSTAGDAKASPFGAARPINTAQREKEIEEKREQQLKEKRDADEKAKEEKRLAKEAAAKEAEEKAAEAAEAAPAAADADKESKTTEAGASDEKIPVRSKGPREGAPPLKTRPSDTGNWRQASGELRSPRVAPSGPRRGGGGPARGGRSDGPRPPRANGSPTTQAASAEGDAEPSTAPVEDEGWTTVIVPKKGRGGRS
jgi:translation initiation factor 4B